MSEAQARICTEEDYAAKFDQRLNYRRVEVGGLYNLMTLTTGTDIQALSIPVVVEEINSNAATLSLSGREFQPTRVVHGLILNDSTWTPQAPSGHEGLFFRKPNTDIVVELMRGYFTKFGHASKQHAAYNSADQSTELGQYLDLLM